MIKRIALALLFGGALCLSACGEQDGSTDDAVANAPAAQQADGQGRDNQKADPMKSAQDKINKALGTGDDASKDNGDASQDSSN